MKNSSFAFASVYSKSFFYDQLPLLYSVYVYLTIVLLWRGICEESGRVFVVSRPASLPGGPEEGLRGGQRRGRLYQLYRKTGSPFSIVAF